MKRLARDRFTADARCLRLGDMVYTPQIPIPFERVRDCIVKFLDDGYITHRMKHSREPRWVRGMTSDVRAHLRASFLRSDGFDPHVLLPWRPYLHMGYVVEEEGLVERTVQALQLDRLRHIRQLGFLHDPVVGDSRDQPTYARTFEHTRFCHVLDVMAVATLIAHQNGITGRLRDTLRVAALSHDALTPAGGDTVKWTDRDAFDEDLRYPELFALPGWSQLKRRYRLSEEALHSVILGKGVLGHILDLADKMAYVAQDAFSYLTKFRGDTQQGFAGPGALQVWLSEGYTAVEHLITAKPGVCALWDAVEVIGDKVAVNDADRLADFLRLRALLFANLYYHPSARFTEHIVARIIVNHLYRIGVLTKENLVRMEDQRLEEILESYTGLPVETTRSVTYPTVETFASCEAAERREAEILEDEPGAVTLIEEFRGGTSAGTNLLVREGKRVIPFKRARPREAQAIGEIMASTEPCRLYSFLVDSRPFKTEFVDLLLMFREERKGVLASRVGR